MSNLISFSCENFGNQAVKSATLVALVVDPVVPTRVGAEINNQKWVISIPLVQSEEAFGVAEIWSLGQGSRFKVIAENSIISRPSLKVVNSQKRNSHSSMMHSGYLY